MKYPTKIRPVLFGNHGFSLMELMIVVGIIAILSAIAVPIYQGYVSGSKRNAAQAVLEQIPVLIENYRAENGRMCPECNANSPVGGYVYNYTENDSGTENTPGANKISITYPDFKPKGESAKASLYDYSVTFTVVGCPACVETARASAVPVPSRGAPYGTIDGKPYK